MAGKGVMDSLKNPKVIIIFPKPSCTLRNFLSYMVPIQVEQKFFYNLPRKQYQLDLPVSLSNGKAIWQIYFNIESFHVKNYVIKVVNDQRFSEMAHTLTPAKVKTNTITKFLPYFVFFQYYLNLVSNIPFLGITKTKQNRILLFLKPALIIYLVLKILRNVSDDLIFVTIITNMHCKFFSFNKNTKINSRI